MTIYLSDLLTSNILDTYQILAGKAYLNREVESISLLETPDFEKYVRERALILTTLYPIRSDIPLFKKLIEVLSLRHVAGIIVKLKRYVDVIPDEIINLCEQHHLPLITIDYDANLSEISTRVLNELTTKSLRTISLSSFYIDLVKTLDHEPKIETLISFHKRFDNMDYWIYSRVQQKTFSTNKKINALAEEIASHAIAFQTKQDYYIYYDEVKLSNQLIYKVVFFSKDDQRSKLYYYAEIIKMMLVFIYQKRQETSLQQNQFLLETITSSAPLYADNEAFQNKASWYGWQVRFPLNMVLCQMRYSTAKETLMPEDLRDHFMQSFDLQKDEIRFININQRLVLLMNSHVSDKIEPTLRKMIQDLEHHHKLLDIKMAYTTNLQSVQDLAHSHATLLRGLNFITQKNMREKIFNNQSVKMFSLLGKIPEIELKEYVSLVLGPLLQYEKKHGGNLIETLYVLINHQFNLKKAATELFVHYNTLRHRLQVLDELGYGKKKLETTHYDLIFAVYLAKNLT
jgi:purine catabolism regulator